MSSPVSPYTPGPTPAPRGLFARALRSARPDDAYHAIVNRLATTPIERVGAAEVSADLFAFGLRGAEARTVLGRIWRDAVVAFLADDEITATESRYLAALRGALGLTEAELREAQHDVVHERLARAAADAVADGRITPDEQARLDALGAALYLPDTVRRRVLERAQQARVQQAAEDAVADGQLTPQELEDLHALAESLGAQLTFDRATQHTLDRLAALWRIDNDELPVVSATLRLQSGETCHATAHARWLERRSRAVLIPDADAPATTRICKGVRYRAGNTPVPRLARAELTEVDTGRVHVTNKRVMFDGVREDTAIPLATLQSFTPCSDGVIIERTRGPAAHLLLTQTDVDLFNATLSAVLARS